MIKDRPSIARIAAMVGFTVSVVGILLFLWIQFGGSIPLQAQGYRFEARFPEAALLVEQADVRLAGLDIGRVVKKELDAEGGATIAEIELDARYSPIPRDTRVTLRQKSLLGETYVELTPGSGDSGDLADGGRLPARATQESVEIDEIVRLFDRPTREAFQGWMHELAEAIEKGRGEDLNNALGNLPDFVAKAEDVLAVLDDQRPALERLIRNSGRTLGAVNERRGQLRELVVNANDTMEALASRNDALAQTIFVLPTFLDETKATLARLRTFATDTRPLVRDLQPVATDLRPTLRDVGRLAPDLRHLFRELSPLIDESERNLPAAARFLRGAEPLLEGLHVYLPELNPILSFANFQQEQVADFFTSGTGSTAATLDPVGDESRRHYLRQYGIINTRGIGTYRERPEWERANAYPGPNYLKRTRPLGIVESFDCKPSDGPKREPSDGEPPCLVAPPSLFDGRLFPRLQHGEAPLRRPPRGNDGSRPAAP